LTARLLFQRVSKNSFCSSLDFVGTITVGDGVDVGVLLLVGEEKVVGNAVEVDKPFGVIEGVSDCVGV